MLSFYIFLSIAIIIAGTGFIWVIPFGLKLTMGFKEDIKRIADSREKSRNCVKCGRSIPWDANLCPYCGHDFT